MKPILYTSQHSHHHDTGAGHPESIQRIEAIDSLFKTAPFDEWEQRTGVKASMQQLLYAHDENYIYAMQEFAPNKDFLPIDEMILPLAKHRALLSPFALLATMPNQIKRWGFAFLIMLLSPRVMPKKNTGLRKSPSSILMYITATALKP